MKIEGIVENYPLFLKDLKPGKVYKMKTSSLPTYVLAASNGLVIDLSDGFVFHSNSYTFREVDAKVVIE